MKVHIEVSLLKDFFKLLKACVYALMFHCVGL